MKFTTSLFAQMLHVIPRSSFLRLVSECGAKPHAKGFSWWDQYVAMLFCQLIQLQIVLFSATLSFMLVRSSVAKMLVN